MDRRRGFCFTTMTTGVAAAARWPDARSLSRSSWRSSMSGPVPFRSFLICFRFLVPRSTTTGRSPSALLMPCSPRSKEHPVPAASLLDDDDHGLGAVHDRPVGPELFDELPRVVEQGSLALAQLLDGLAAAAAQV